MLSEKQAEEIKKQLISQVEGNFPGEKKEFAVQQINSMDNEQLEQFLIQNKLVAGDQTHQSQSQCVFCSIITGDIQSFKIDENEKAIAVLEINPVSKGHTIIIPKEHVSSSDKLPKEVDILTKKIGKQLKTKLKVEKIETSSSNVFGHETINVIPVYEGEKISNERKQADPKELAELQKNLAVKPKPKIISKKPKPKKITATEKIRLPKRIP